MLLHFFTGMQRLPFFPENRVRGAFEPRHHWPEQGNRLRWVSIQTETCLCFRVQCRCLHSHNTTTKSSCVCFREATAEDPVEPEDAGGQVAPVAAGLAAVERLQRAAQQEDAGASQGQPSPPKRPFRTPSVPSLCALATRATVHLMTGERPRWVEYAVERRFSEKVSHYFVHPLWWFLTLLSQLPVCSTAAVWQA